MMTDEDLTAINDRADEVGPGPFTVELSDSPPAMWHVVCNDLDVVGAQWQEYAAAIADAFNDRVALLDEVERLRGKIAAMNISAEDSPISTSAEVHGLRSRGWRRINDPNAGDTTRGDA